MSKKIKKVVLPVGALTLVGAIGALTASQLAYLTDEETALNTFTIGDVKVDVKEPHYPGNDSDEVSHVIPNQEIAKDPQVENTGTDGAVVFTQFSIPVANITLVANDGTKQDKAYTALFDTIVSTRHEEDKDGNGKIEGDDEVWYTEDTTGRTEIAAPKTGTHGSYISDQWVLIGNEKYVDSEGNVVLYKTADGYKKADGTVIKKKDNDTENAASLNEISDDILKNIAKVVYTAGYKTVLEKDQVTDPIFDQVKLVNFKDDDGLENTDRTVGVTSMVIQADNLGEDITLPDRTHETETTDDDTFSAETLKKIYEIYFNQSVKGSDDDTVDNKIIDEKSKNSDYVNDYNIKGTQIIKSSFTDASEAFEDKKALTVGALTSDTITLTTTLNNVALTEDQADQMDTLSTVKAYYVTTVEDDLGVAEPTVTETECGDDVQVTYTRDAADSTKYTIKLIARKVTPERVSKDGQTTTTTIKLKLTSTQGVTANINGMTVSEAPDEYEEVGADSADGDGEEEGEEY